MDLNPKFPPGRINRKTLEFVAEIQRLRREGYTFEAIRLALLEAGIQVSRTTIKREPARRHVTPRVARRPAVTAPARPTPARNAVAAPAPPSAPLMPASSDLVGDPRTGIEIADAFFEDFTTNPLIRQR